MTTQGKNVMVTMASGLKFARFYEKNFKESQLRFAKRINTHFEIVDDLIEATTEPKHPAWQKLLIFKHPKIAPYDRALFVDADVYITKHASNPFEIIGENEIGMVKNNPYDIPALRETDLVLYQYCPKENRPDILLNTGVFIVPKTCRSVMENVFYGYKEQPCYENGPFSYHVLNDSRKIFLPTKFNTLVVCYRTAFGQGLSTILKMYEESSFLHFAGGPTKTMPTLHIIRFIDTTESVFLKKCIYFLGNEKLDWLTAPLLHIIKTGMLYSRRFFGKK